MTSQILLVYIPSKKKKRKENPHEIFIHLFFEIKEILCEIKMLKLKNSLKKILDHLFIHKQFCNLKETFYTTLNYFQNERIHLKFAENMSLKPKYSIINIEESQNDETEKAGEEWTISKVEQRIQFN